MAKTKITMELHKLKTLKLELKRFNTRLNEAIARIEKEEHSKYGCKETGALKRASIDLKNELTKQLKS